MSVTPSFPNPDAGRSGIEAMISCCTWCGAPSPPVPINVCARCFHGDAPPCQCGAELRPGHYGLCDACHTPDEDGT